MTPADILPQITTLFNPDVWTITANPLGVRIEHKGEPLVFDVTEERVAMTTTLRPASSLRWRGPQTDRRLCDGDPVEALLTLASEAGSWSQGFDDLPQEARDRHARRWGRL